MPCSLAIRRGLRRAELPADARERRRRTSKKGEGEGSRGKGRASYVSRRTYRRVKVGNREKERGGGMGDLCGSYEGYGMGRHMYRGHSNGKKENGG